MEFYSGEEPNEEEVLKMLNKYGGGSIEYSQDIILGIAKICINHPEKKNAISGTMMIEFREAVNKIEQWSEAKGVLVYGKNDIFCSGGDLDVARNECNPNSGYQLSTYMTKTLTKLAKLPVVSVAYVDGLGAIGGGAEILTACDFRVMSNNPNTKISFVHNKMGITPAWGGCARLVSIVGKQKALELLLSCRMVGYEEAYRMSLINNVVNSYEDALTWLCHLTRHGSNVVRCTKLSVLNASNIDNDIVSFESKLFAPLWGGSDNKMALRANVKHKSFVLNHDHHNNNSVDSSN